MNEHVIRLNQDFLDAIKQCKSFNYTPTNFIQMLDRYGPVDTAIQLISDDKYSEGFLRMWKEKRLELTVEAIIYHEPNYHGLVGQGVVEKARKKLSDYKYFDEYDQPEDS